MMTDSVNQAAPVEGSRAAIVVAADGTRFAACIAAPRGGAGPALLMLPGGAGLDEAALAWCKRFADEGYAVLAPDLSRHFDGHAFALTAALADVAAARPALGPHLEAGARWAAIAFGAGASVGLRLAAHGAMDALVLYAPSAVINEDVDAAFACPVTAHLAADAASSVRAAFDSFAAGHARRRVYVYDGTSTGFADPARPGFDRHAAAVAHSRTLAAIRPVIGPHYDLARLFQEHLRHEFVTHDPHATMATMVAEPYVNHVPTLTGGFGHAMLKRFYTHHFIPKLPDERRSVVLSETVGADTIVLELVTRFTHSVEIDYLLPGIPPSGKTLEIPTVIIAKFRGDKLYHEHIYWDQASLLVQLGLIDPKGLPVAGAEEAHKMLDQSRPANELMARWRDSQGEPI
jgi:carboxymethylenebutenolidase